MLKFDFVQPLAAGAADLPVSHELGKIFTVCRVCNECTRGKGGAADFIVPMYSISVAFCSLQIS